MYKLEDSSLSAISNKYFNINAKFGGILYMVSSNNAVQPYYNFEKCNFRNITSYYGSVVYDFSIC